MQLGRGRGKLHVEGGHATGAGRDELRIDGGHTTRSSESSVDGGHGTGLAELCVDTGHATGLGKLCLHSGHAIESGIRQVALWVDMQPGRASCVSKLDMQLAQVGPSYASRMDM